MQKRLHLGCGKNYLPPSEGWINHDLFSSLQADIYADMAALPFEKNTFDLVYAGHVAEHCHRRAVLATFAHWRDILKPGGTLRIAVPNFAACVEWYNETGDLTSILGLLYAGQNHPKNNHYIIFDKKTLTEHLTKVGFVDVRERDWRTTDHAEYDDYASCYLPHLDKANGKLMSLNLQATKPL